MIRPRLLPLASVAVLGLGESAPPGEDRPYLAESTREMAERLSEIAEGLDSGMAAFGGSPVATFEKAPAPSDPGERIPFEASWGEALLFEGRSEEAVAKFEGALRTLRALPGFSATSEESILRLLASAYLRLGEQENCVGDHNIDSCLLPIRESGVHRFPRGARAAMEIYRSLAEAHPEDLGSRWLLNLSAMTVGEYPDGLPESQRIPPKAFESEAPLGRFLDVAPRAGLDVTGLSGGCALEDFDGDGDLDVMASSWGPLDPLRYFRNEGNGTFAERTEAAGLTGLGGGLNLVHADFDDNGFADVLVLRGAWLGARGRHPNSLLRNNGDGTFDDATVAAGLVGEYPTQTAAWADFDADGRLDLYVGNESTSAAPHVTQLFHNRGDGTFEEIAPRVGLAGVAYVKGVAWGDIDNDGLPDLYLSTLFGTNLLFHNGGPRGAGGWGFREVGEEAGVRLPDNSFPAWFWDYDNDGWLDLFAAAYPVGILRGDKNEVPNDYLGLPTTDETPRVYRNRRDGTFEDATRAVGMDRVTYTMGSNFGDVDNDGWLDVYLGTGAPPYTALMPNRMFRNDGGRRFQDVTTAGGFGHLQKGHAIAFGDLDDDGDQDVYAVMGGSYVGDVYPNALFENPGYANRWITLRLEGTRSNRSAIGARVRVVVQSAKSGERTIHSVVSTGGSFGSSSLRQEIGLGDAKRILRVEVDWPASGEKQVYEGLALDSTWRIREGDPVPHPVDLRPFSFPKAGGAHRHH